VSSDLSRGKEAYAGIGEKEVCVSYASTMYVCVGVCAYVCDSDGGRHQGAVGRVSAMMSASGESRCDGGMGWTCQAAQAPQADKPRAHAPKKPCILDKASEGEKGCNHLWLSCPRVFRSSAMRQ